MVFRNVRLKSRFGSWLSMRKETDGDGGPCGSERALGRLETLKSVKSNRTLWFLGNLSI